MSPIERHAIAVKSVTAAGEESLGLIVSATFGGDVERYFGQGALKRALIVMTLVGGSTRAMPVGLIDQGGGFTLKPYPLVFRQRGRLSARLDSLELFSPERVSRVTPTGSVWAVRDDNRIVFYISGAWVGGVTKVRLEVFAASPVSRGVGAGAAWQRVVRQTPTVQDTTNVDAAALSSSQLSALQLRLSGLLSAGVEPELLGEEHASADLTASLHSYARLARIVHRIPGLRRLRRSDLVNGLRQIDGRIGDLEAEIAAARQLIARIDGLMLACAFPSPSPTLPEPSGAAPIVAVQTDAGLCQALTPVPSPGFSTSVPRRVPVVDVNDQLRYQQFSGLGAAMTDSSAWLIYEQLPIAARLPLIQDLFGVPGIHLNLLRVPVAASDFTDSPEPYTYDDVPAGQSDPDLAQFSIGHDLAYIIPTLRLALATNPSLTILATPWSPPAWMKSSDLLSDPNGLGTLLPSAYGPFARYLVRFIEAYQSNGVPIEAITPENEPGADTPYPGMTLSSTDEATLISGYLEPALAAAGLHTKIYGNDLSWFSLPYADALVSGPAAGDLSGIAWHCYFGLPSVMTQLHQAAPGFDQIVDECSPEVEPFQVPEFVISALRNWASEVTVWNVALDPQGGPKQPENGCKGCMGVVTINEQTHAVSFGPEYFQLGQVSDFVQPGATIIGSPNFVSYAANNADIETVSNGLDDVAFLNPDGTEGLVAYNNSGASIRFAVESDGRYFTYTIPASAMATFTWR